MGTLLQSESRRLYSWWWDSHISPKNSKWLQENLTDMDAKVKTMIKLIEEDADSFARRAEMYYKKRPELMKLVEEFYRAYRALAERYDHATGALRQAHKTMAEAFPNQVPFALSDDSPSGSSANESGPHTPDMPHPLRAFLDPDDLHKDAMGVSSSQFRAIKKNGAYSDESDSLTSKKGLKQLNDLFGSEGRAHHAKFAEGRVRKGLNFHEEEGNSSQFKARNGSGDLSSHEANGKEQSLQDGTSEFPESAQSGEAETKVQTLTDAIAKLEAETEASLLHYKQSLERLSTLEAEVSRAHEDSKGLNERARKAENEVETLKQSLARLEDEKEAGLVQYHQCSERISNLETKVFHAEEDAGRLNERASKAETEVQILEKALAKTEAEKEAGLVQYQQCLERISILEARISQAERDAGKFNERAVKAEAEIQALKQTLARLESEKEAGLAQYKQSLEMISNLETKIANAAEDARKLTKRAEEAESDVQSLKCALDKIEAEKEAALVQYKQCLEIISNLETRICQAEEDAAGYNEQVIKVDAEFQSLKQAFALLESEKEDWFVKYQQSLETVSNLETKISNSEEHATRLAKRAEEAEADVQSLKQVIASLESEKEAGLVQYNRCLEMISNLETRISQAEEDAGGFNERATKAEAEAHSLKQTLARLESEKEAVNFDYNKCLENISNLETKIFDAEENARKLSERAENAEATVQSLKKVVSALHEEKETAAQQYQQCVETISNLEAMILQSQEEANNLNTEIAMGAANLSSVEEQNLLLERANQSLQAEVDTLAQLTGKQKQELLEKHEELDRLRLRIQEESLRSEQAESSLQKFEDLLSQSQEERRSLSMELQRGVLMLKDVERWNQALEDEVQHLKEENRSLNEQNSSSDMSIKAMHEEIFSWREVAGKLEEEVSLRTDERNALQQEIYCLKEEVNDLNRRHQAVIEQVETVGLKPDSLGSSVQDLQVENSNLKEICQKSKDEKLLLLEKLENMENLLQKNALLESSLSDVNADLDGLRKKVKALEESYEYLQGEKFVLVAEKATLVSQLELVSDDMEKLLEKNTLVENSLSDANAELEYLREKSTNLEESYRSLDNEKSGLLTERDTLVFHLQNIQRRLEELEKKSTELEEKYSNLEEEKTSTLLQVEGLQNSLDLQKQEHATFVQTSETRLASLEDQILLVQEEGRWRKKEFEEEQDKAMNAQFEIFILQNSIRDMEEKNFSMLIECQKHFEASKMSEQLICELEHEYLEQQVEAESLVSQLEGLRTGIRQVLKALEIEPDYEGQHEIEEEKMLLQHILGKIEEMKSTSLTVQEENQQLLLEKSVVATLLGQLRLEAADLEIERNALTQEVNMKSGELLLLQSEKLKLFELNEQFRAEVKAVELREKVLKAEMQNLSVKLKALQEENLILRYDLCEARDENIFLEKKCSELEEKNGILEDENINLLGEAIALDNLFLVSKSYGEEKAVELVGLGEDLVRLHGLNNDLNNKFTTVEQKLASVEMENMDHKGIIVELESELETVRDTSNRLKHQLQTERNALYQKESELSEAEMKLKSTESEKLELHGDLEVLEREKEEARLIMVGLENQNLKQLEESMHQSNEIRHLCEATKKLETEVARLHEQIEDGKVREKSLSFDLQNEVKQREAEAATLYADNQISAIRAALYEEKVHTLIGACERLEDENISKQTEIEHLKERNNILEDESRGLKSKLAAYLPVIVSLRENIISLEDSALSKMKISLADYQEPKDGEFGSHLNSECCQELSEGKNQMMEDGVSDLQELQTSVKSIEEALKEMESLAKKEILDVSIRLQAAMKEIEDLKGKSSINREKTVQSSRDTAKQLEGKHGEQPSKLDTQKDDPEISELGNEISMKDIPLDQISECSSYDHGFGSHGLSKRENTESDDQMLELWETTERDSSLNLSRPVNMRNVPSTSYHQNEAVEQMSDYPSSELQAEKELAVDKLELSKRLTEPHQEANKRKITERLASDAQKLTNLQITIHDLRKKMETPKKNKKAKGTELDSIQRQLQVIEEHIVHLAEVNSKLTKNAEEVPLPYTDRNTGEELEESRKVRRRRVLEQAREGSEKIGRLQLEVQRIQFLLLKLEDEHGAKGPAVANRNAGILLRDFIYQGRSKDKRKKKAPCCACMRPSTREE